MCTKFGEWLFRWRFEQKLSVRNFGKLVDMAGAYISAIETGRRLASRAFLDKFFTAFPTLPRDEVTALWAEDMKVHKKMKFNRSEMVIWMRALEPLDDPAKLENIRKALEENGIDIPFQNPDE